MQSTFKKATNDDFLYLDYMNVKKDKLPKIFSSDVIVRLNGYNVGDVISVIKKEDKNKHYVIVSNEKDIEEDEDEDEDD